MMRQCKLWNERELLDVLLLADKLALKIPQLFALVSSNLLMFFIYYIDNQEVELNAHLISDETIFRVLKAYENQFDNVFINTSQTNAFVGLPMLALKVFDQLPLSSLLVTSVFR